MIDPQTRHFIDFQGNRFDLSNHLPLIPETKKSRHASPRRPDRDNDGISRKVTDVMRKIKRQINNNKLPDTVPTSSKKDGIGPKTLEANTVTAFSKKELKKIPDLWDPLLAHFRTEEMITNYIRSEAS